MPRPSRPTTRATRATAGRRRSGGLPLVWIGLALVLVLIAGLVTFAIVSESNNRDISATQTYEYDGGQHVAGPVDYTESPPVGGEHNSIWWNCGVYTTEIPQEHAVHALEHGAVWLTYQSDLPEDQVASLTELADAEFMMLSPYDDQDTPVVATAWGHQLELDSVDEAKLREFIDTYKQGPQTPEPGAACSGGTTSDLVERG